MSQTLLVSGPPGCGKTSWILSQIQSHSGPSGYLRLSGYPDEGLAQARDGGIDLALAPHPAGLLALIELPQFHPPAQTGLAGMDRRILPQLEALHLSPDRHLHFGRDPELPRQDTLDFSHLQA
jgi:GTPase SAR1 family protein